jgi:hypothetical protein
VQLHQLTPNAIAQLSKYFWAVLSFGGVPTSDDFTKRYELHYQPKKVEVDGGVMFQQFGCVNFHVKRYRGSRVKVTLAVNNKWATGWAKMWFYCKVPTHICPDSNSGDVAFIKVASATRGRHMVEEYLAC